MRASSRSSGAVSIASSGSQAAAIFCAKAFLDEPGEGLDRTRPRRRRFGRCPAFLPDQRHEPDVGQIFAPVLGLRNAGDANEFLHLWIASDRNDQPPADLELLLQRFGNLRPAGGDNDAVIGRVLGPSFRPIAVEDMNVVIAEIGEPEAAFSASAPWRSTV